MHESDLEASNEAYMSRLAVFSESIGLHFMTGLCIISY